MSTTHDEAMQRYVIDWQSPEARNHELKKATLRRQIISLQEQIAEAEAEIGVLQEKLLELG